MKDKERRPTMKKKKLKNYNKKEAKAKKVEKSTKWKYVK